MAGSAELLDTRLSRTLRCQHAHPRKDRGVTLYALAANRLFWQPGDPFTYPYSVDLQWDGKEWRVVMSEGVTFSAAAAIVSVDEALSPAWVTHLEKAEAGWLRPYLERIAVGDDVRGDELVAAFEKRHHRPLHG